MPHRSLAITLAALAVFASSIPLGPDHVGASSCQNPEGCHLRTDSTENDDTVLLQSKASIAQHRAQAGLGGTKDEDAHFLMQATFGPTRESLEEVSGGDYDQWIEKQMKLPVESHRAYFRERANMRSLGISQEALVGKERSKCEEGSRWTSFAFTKVDEGKAVRVEKNRIFVDNKLRTHLDPQNKGNAYDVQTCDNRGQPIWVKATRSMGELSCEENTRSMGWRCKAAEWVSQKYCQKTCFDAGHGYDGDDCSGGWFKMEFTGFLCRTEEIIGGEVILSESADCKQKKKFMRNPAIWFTPSFTKAPVADKNFNVLRPGVILLAETPQSCELGDFIQSDTESAGQRYMYDPRLELVDNAKSPGEVANNPGLGHKMPFWTMFSSREDEPSFLDRDVDYPYESEETSYNRDVSVRATVWTMKALYAKDQFRQRMAWALSQVVVLGEVTKFERYTELYMNFYDIFVRHAFGNYRDVLREVTNSIVMAKYLTYENNQAFDVKGNYPDENFAREVMQLYSIGLWKLNPDGSRAKDANGEDIPTYSNDQIMDVARVFTAFKRPEFRTNSEFTKTGHNVIDPIALAKNWHDIYPKPDLDGNFLGDGYPVCSDVAPTGDQATRPTCVDLYFFNGQVMASANKFWNTKCVDPSTRVAGTSCCGGCTDKSPDKKRSCAKLIADTKALNVKLTSKGRKTRAYCNQHASWKKRAAKGNPKCQLTCSNEGLGYAGDSCKQRARQEIRICDNPGQKVLYDTAKASCASKDLAVCPVQLKAADKDCGNSDMDVWTPETCSFNVVVNADGAVSSTESAQSKANFVSVPWTGGFPGVAAVCSATGCKASDDGSCECGADVETRPVFSGQDQDWHDAVQVKEKLKIGAVPPAGEQAPECQGEVCVYKPNGAMDETSVFEYSGRFYKNVVSVVRIGEYEFRNPPIFMKRYPEARGFKVEEDVHAEVESFLDHLLYHPNTPTFLGHRLIQRLVTSNPSGPYVEAVGEAFRTGKYGAKTYSGQYGDLAATFAAILLHPEARNQVSDSNGALREPLGKLIHFMRAMEYKDNAGREVRMQRLIEVIGQWPYESPTVFNYYLPEYEPDRFPHGKVGPEFQILTAPMSVGFINGMNSLIQHGLGSCDRGFGYNSVNCADGELTYQPAASKDEALQELDVLLTGGRLSEGTKAYLSDVYDAADDGEKLKAVQEAIILTPEFNTLGSPLPTGTRPPSPAPKALHDARPYKAVVQIFFAGGADTFNLLVPMSESLYKEYTTVRKDVALKPSQLNKIQTDGQAFKDFGIHSQMSFLKDLYDKGSAAFVSNVGGLVEPLTREQFHGKSGKICKGLYSHADMQQAAATLKCQTPGAAPKGAGGRIADALAAGKDEFHTTSFSIDGVKTWSQGFQTNQEIIDAKEGAVRIWNLTRTGPIVDTITSVQHNNIYCEEYAKTLAESIVSTEQLGEYLDASELKTEYTPEGKLSQQLRQVARLIATRNDRKAERDFFFVSLGGWDTHASVEETLFEKLKDVDDALGVFVKELQEQNVFEQTVIVSHSDFGRTLTPNGGAGTDHAWAGNHFVIGGGIKGGRVFNDFPTSLLEGNDQDAGRGRMIPKYPWESVMVPIAQWMGLAEETSALEEVFPNLGNFNSTRIIGRDALFKA